MILYHATFGAFVDNIRTDGIVSHLDGNDNDNWGWGREYKDEIFLSDDIDVAASFCETADHVSDAVYDTGIYVVSVDVDEELLGTDPFVDGENSFVHYGTITPDRIVNIRRYD